MINNWLDANVLEALVSGCFSEPFSVLGMHRGDVDGKILIRTFQPQAQNVYVLEYDTGDILGQMERIHESGVFQIEFDTEDFFKYRLRIDLWTGDSYDTEDAYRFPPVLGDMDIYYMSEGTHLDEYDRLGAHPITHEGVEGVCFAVWAPNAHRVSVVGTFNEWDGRRHQMRQRGISGVWELFIPHISEGCKYKYEILGADWNLMALKADPVAFYAEKRPSTASVVYDLDKYEWKAKGWEKKREKINAMDAPMSIYEVHLGSWRRRGDDGSEYMSYTEMAKELVDYVKEMGFTHVEMLPVNEHPFDGSWGYQATGLYAPTSRFGTPDEFRELVDAFHQAGIGVIMDWVPGHFPKDSFGLSYFDGTALYEHADPRRGEHKDWGTKIYNYGRREVNNFLTSNAMFWNKKYQVDGLRVDAVASMLYLDYSRKQGEWIPNKFGGHEDLEAVDFLKRTNELVYENCAGAITVAEESTAWPMVSRPTYMGGLGFGYKWNMGWMHDTLDYMALDPIYRRYNHGKMTFAMLYAYNENFVLPLSHDEVVHGKCSLLHKMSGDRWQRFANLRAYYGFMYTHPGKKLLFMGGEFAQDREWDYNSQLSWHLLSDPMHRGVQQAVKDLNRIYRDTPALYQRDYDPSGFEWIEADNADESTFAFIRHGDNPNDMAVIVSNFTPVPRQRRFGVPKAGKYIEIFNSDSEIYGGSGMGNMGGVTAVQEESHMRPYSIDVTVPPLATVIFVPQC